MKNWMMLSMFALVGCKSEAASLDNSKPKEMTLEQRIERGKFLTKVSACNDCHTPFKMGPNGPETDWSRELSGHPAEMEVPPPPPPQGPWIASIYATNTAWAGPWGVSFTANLTPDNETGTGTWSRENFIATIKNGRHMGAGRPLLPPMPAAMYANYSEEELGMIYDYTRTLKPIKNKVPAPRPPAAPPGAPPVAPTGGTK